MKKITIYNNSNSQTHDNENEIARQNDSNIKNIYDLSSWKNIDTKLRDLLVEKDPIRITHIDFPKDNTFLIILHPKIV